MAGENFQAEMAALREQLALSEQGRADAERERAAAERTAAAAERERAAAERERAAAERERADAERERAAATERAEVLGRLLIAANAPPATTAPPLSVQRAVDLLTLAERTHTIASPSKGRGVCSDHLALFEFDAEPHVAALRELVHRGSLAAVASCAGATDVAGNNCGQLLKEGSLYPLTTSYVPSWVTATRRTPQRGGSSPAFRVFGLERIDRVASPGFVLPWNCQPELFTEALPFHPAFNGEVKSAMSSGDSAESPGMFDQIFTYVMLGMAASLFRDVPDGHRRYFKHPPIGYGLAAFPHVGYIVAVEWIGLLFVSVVSQSFFLGSPEHEAAVAALPDHDYEPDKVEMDVRGVKVFTYPPQAADARAGARAGAGGGSGSGAKFRQRREHRACSLARRGGEGPSLFQGDSLQGLPASILHKPLCCQCRPEGCVGGRLRPPSPFPRPRGAPLWHV